MNNKTVLKPQQNAKKNAQGLTSGSVKETDQLEKPVKITEVKNKKIDAQKLPTYRSNQRFLAFQIKKVIHDEDLATQENRETDGSLHIFPLDESLPKIKVARELIPNFENPEAPIKGRYLIILPNGSVQIQPSKIFEDQFTLEDEKGSIAMEEKTLSNTTASQATQNVSDIKFFGDGDTFKLVCKASSENQGWMKSTKAMEIEGVGCVVQVTTQQRNPDGSYSIAEALAFVPQSQISELVDDQGNVSARNLVASPK